MPQRLESGRAVTLKQKKRKPAPAPKRVVIKPLVQSVATARKPGLESVVRKGKADVARAENRALGKPVEPHVPLLRKPTSAQKAEAVTIYNRSRNAQLPKGVSGAAKTKAIYDFAERQRVAKQDEKLRAGREAVKSQRKSLALRVLRQTGDFKGRPGSQERDDRGERVLARLPQAKAEAGDQHKRVRLPGATIDLSLASSAVAQKIARGPGDAPGQLLLNTVKDVGALGSSPFVAGVEAGKATLALRRGDVKPLVKLAKGTAEGFANSAPGLLVQGKPKEAGEEFRAHPLLNALTVAGGVGAVGRVGGAVARGAGSTVEAAGVRGALARAGSTARSPLTASESGAPVLLKERRYSKDLTRKAVQVERDKTREPLRDGEGNVVTVRRGGRDVPVLKAKGTSILGGDGTGRGAVGPFRTERQKIQDSTVDRAANRADSANRMIQAETPRAETKLYGGRIRGRMKQNDKDIVGLVRSGTVRPQSFMEDTRKYRQKIEDAYQAHLAAGGDESGGTAGSLTKAEVQANRRNAKRIDKFLQSNPSGERVARIVGTARQSARVSVANDKALESVLGADKDRLKKARLSEYAMAHMGARFEEAEGASAAGKDTVRLRVEKPASTRRGVVRVGDKTIERGAGKVKLSGADLTLLNKDTPLTAEEAAKLTRILDRVRKARDQGERLRVGRYQGRSEDVPASKRVVSAEEIEAHARAHGVNPDELAHLPHRMEELGSRAYYRSLRPGSRGVVSRNKRTGALYERGAVTHKQQAVIDARVNQERQVEQARQIDKVVRETAVIKPNGRPFTGSEADAAIKQLKEQTGEDYVKVSLAPASLPADVREAIIKGVGAREAESLPQQLLASRVLPKGAGAENVGLMPKRMMSRFEQHVAPAGDLERMFQAVNRAFRYAVLPQPRWLTGNFVEPFFVRGPMSGTGVNLPGLAMDVHAMRRIRKVGQDPEFQQVWKQVEAENFGGLVFSARGASVKRSAADMPGIVRRLGGLEHIPAVTHMAQMGGKAFLAPFKAIFDSNKILETSTQKVAFGHQARREAHEALGSWLKAARMGDEAAKEVLTGLRDGPKANQFLDAADELLGKYAGFSPGMRKLTQTIAPFLPWFLNAARFVYWTMPAHHTVAESFLLNAEKAYQQEWDDAHKDAPKGGLKLAIPRRDGGFVDVARYTPFGLSGPISQGDFGDLAAPLFPQTSGTVAALGGKDPFNRDLQVSKDSGDRSGVPTTLQKSGIAGNALLEGLVPGLAMGRRLREGGGTSLANSTIFSPKAKPDSSHGMSAANRTFNPFRPTYLHLKSQGAKANTPEARAIQREADQIAAQQASPAQQREAEALQREADAILKSR